MRKLKELAINFLVWVVDNFFIIFITAAAIMFMMKKDFTTAYVLITWLYCHDIKNDTDNIRRRLEDG